MKKSFTFALLLTMAVVASAQEKKIKVIEPNANKTFSQLLGSDRYEIDSLIIVNDFGKFLGAEEFGLLRDCCEKGRLTGIDMSRCMGIEDNKIPDNAFYPTMANAKPRKNGSMDEPNAYRTNLHYISLPNYIESIGDNAFAFTNIEVIALPRWISSVGSGAFAGCENLKDVVLYGRKRHSDVEGAGFSGLPSDAVLHVAGGLGDYYRSSTGWSAFGTVKEDNALFRQLTIDLDGSRTLAEALGEDDMHVDSLTVSGLLTEADCELLEDNIHYGRLAALDLSDCNIEKGYLWNCRLTTLRMPTRITTIPSGFLGYSKVDNIVMPEAYDEVGRGAFEAFSGFTDSTLVIPEGCRKLGYRAFTHCKSIKKMVLPSTLSVLEPVSLGFNYFQEGTELNVNLYVNRMTPPECPDGFITSSGDFSDTSDTGENGPFGCHLTGVNCLTHSWILFVPVGAKKNYENAEHWSHFTTIIETPLLTGSPTGIGELPHMAAPAYVASPADGIYTLDGRLVSTDVSARDLQTKGLYIVRENGQTRKVVMGR